MTDKVFCPKGPEIPSKNKLYLVYLRLNIERFIKREVSQLRTKRKAFNFYSTKENRSENRNTMETQYTCMEITKEDDFKTGIHNFLERIQ